MQPIMKIITSIVIMSMLSGIECKSDPNPVNAINTIPAATTVTKALPGQVAQLPTTFSPISPYAINPFLPYSNSLVSSYAINQFLPNLSTAPVATPLSALVATPFAAPVAAPFASPVATPFSAPVATPFSAPVAAPFAAPVGGPFAAPLPSPYTAPLTDNLGFNPLPFNYPAARSIHSIAPAIAPAPLESLYI